MPKSDRAKTLIDSVIDQLAIDETYSDIISWLATTGFTVDELVSRFGFSRDDVSKALSDNSN